LKFLADSWYLFVIALVSGFLLFWPTLRRGVPAGGVSCKDAVHLINRERAVVIDVRETAEFAAGHVVNAKNLKLADVEAGTGLPKNKALPLVLVCEGGAKSSRAVVALRKLGFENARTLAGGLKAWREAGLPLEKSS
jgi:rhodanese-related sulfurtransferase